MSWRFVNAAVRGTSHEVSGAPCQDDCFVDVAGDVLVAIASDGAGSASRSEEGAGLTCETLLRCIEEWLRTGSDVEDIRRETVEEWVGNARAVVEARAVQMELTLRDFACTVVGAIVGLEAAAFFQIGDGAAVTGSHGQYDVVFWPSGGEYANMTYFTTDDDWREHLAFEVRAGSIDDVAVMTDGLQRLALQFDARAAHVPFFEPMFGVLQNAEPGFATSFEVPLVVFLGSEAVNARTDDDKSLVLATRRSGAARGTV